MLRHASVPTRSPARVLHKPHPLSFTVVSCPDGVFRREAIFSQTDVELGLIDGCWPEGTVFSR